MTHSRYVQEIPTLLIVSSWKDHTTLKLFSSNTCQITLRKMLFDKMKLWSN